MAEDEARIKKEAEEKASREPKSIPVIGGSSEHEEVRKLKSYFSYDRVNDRKSCFNS